jgi:hypothetical protein
MVATIAPLVKGPTRERFWAAWIGHVVGGALGGAILGAALGAVGTGLAQSRLAVPIIAAVALAYALHEAGVVRLPVLSLPTAVPFDWRIRFGRVRAACLYGFVLAFGFTGRTPFPSLHILLLLVLVSGDAAVGAVTVAVYGAARAAVPLVAAAGLGADAADRLGTLARPQPMHALNAAALSLAGVALLVAFIR